LVFTKYLGDTDEEGTPIYPFTACIRNMRIIPWGLRKTVLIFFGVFP
jgi:hypothetical protein